MLYDHKNELGRGYFRGEQQDSALKMKLLKSMLKMQGFQGGNNCWIIVNNFSYVSRSICLSFSNGDLC